MISLVGTLVVCLTLVLPAIGCGNNLRSPRARFVGTISAEDGGTFAVIAECDVATTIILDYD